MRNQDPVSAANRDPARRLSHLEEIIPAQKFSAWREQQRQHPTNSTPFPQDFRWLVHLICTPIVHPKFFLCVTISEIFTL